MNYKKKSYHKGTCCQMIVVWPDELPAWSLPHIGGDEVHHDAPGHGWRGSLHCGAWLRRQHQGDQQQHSIDLFVMCFLYILKI